MNEGDGLGMKVPCELVINGQHRFIDILRGQLPIVNIFVIKKFKCVLTDFLFSYIERFLRSVEIQP